jgi:prolyl-tRNA editing enzyme YbaK/EbsC (Cys-tRNA(Pro) deacylase)
MPTFPKPLAKYLEKAGFKHQPVEHRKVFTAYDTAMTTRRPLEQVAKNVIVRAGNALHMLVVPAHHQIDFKAVAKQLGVGANKVKIVTEQAIAKAAGLAKGKGFSSFGSMYKLPVLVEKDLLKAKEALFAAGTFTHSVSMKTKDFVASQSATVARFGKVNKPLLAYSRKLMAKVAKAAKAAAAKRKKRPSKGKPKARPKVRAKSKR